VAFVRRGRGRFRRVEPGLRMAGAAPIDQIVVVPAAARAGAPAPDLAERPAAGPAARRAVHARTDRTLIPLSMAAFAAGFVGLPLAVYKADPSADLVHALFGALAVLWLAVVVVAGRGLAAAGVPLRERALALSPLLFFPPSVAHAPSFVWRDLYAGFETSAVAAALGAASAYDLDGPPDPGAAARCPSCGVQYRAGFTRCSDCDLDLVPFAPLDETGAAGDGARSKT
jgi:hypothetical protein